MDLPPIPRAQALAAALTGTLHFNNQTLPCAVAGDLATALTVLEQPVPDDCALPNPPGLRADLRTYQRAGLHRLTQLVNAGITGAILGDEMGLGKTLTAIALHLQLVHQPPGFGPTLVACPASLITNWIRELARFAPNVTVHRYHGANRTWTPPAPGDVLVTSYDLLHLDHDRFRSVAWGLGVADEAHFVKTNTTARAKALTSLNFQARLAVTGTLVDTRPADLWSLLDWTNPGVLGPLPAFQRRYGRPIEKDPQGPEALEVRRILTPLMVRRLKRDVAQELPDKIYAPRTVPLTPEQATLYQAAVDAHLPSTLGTSGLKRHTAVLRLITHLRKICNHPAHLLAETHPGDPSRAGKIQALDDILDETDTDTATVVFTDFVAMGRLLHKHLENRGITAGFLHGQLTDRTRTRLVDTFQNGELPVLLVSIRAGGTGLTLTRASNAVLYDRPWSPGVEDQAVDRLHRIGQERTVIVHPLGTDGTIEARIADLLAHKRAITDSILGPEPTDITAIAQLDDEALQRLVTLTP